MAGVHELIPSIGNAAACRSLEVWRGQAARDQARQHRLAFIGPRRMRATRPRPPLALAAQEREVLLNRLNSERFADSAPATVYATLLDEGGPPWFGAHHVPAAGGQRWLTGAPQPALPSGLRQA